MRPWARLTVTTLLAVLGGVAAVEGRAQSEPAWARWCAAKPDAAAKPLLARDAMSLRANAPALAVQRACVQLAGPGADRWPAALELAEALIAGSRGADARRLLDELQARAPSAGPARAALHLAQAALELHQERHARAGEQAALALAQLPATDGSPLRLRALLLQTSALLAAGRPEDLRQAEAVLAEVDGQVAASGLQRSRWQAELLNRRTLLANARSDFAEVERLARLEWRLLRALDGADAASQLDAIATLGAMISTGRRYAQTLRVLEEGRRIARLHPEADRSATIGILNNLSPSLIDLGRPEQALAVAEEAMAAAVEHWGRGSLRTLTPLNRRSAAFEVLQRWTEARQDHEEITAILRREGALTRIERRLRLLDNAAAFHMRMNDFDEAERQLIEGLALTADGRGDRYWRGRMLGRQGRLLAERGAWAQAEASYRDALALLTPAYGAGHPYLVQLQARQCEAQLRSAAEPQACAAVSAALGRLVDAGAPERVTAQLAVAAWTLQQGQPASGWDHLQHALAAAQAGDGQGLLWWALDRAAQALRQQGRDAAAVLLAKAALGQIEQVRGRLRGQRDVEAGFLKDKHAVYRRLADWLMADGRSDEALQVQQLLKGQELRDFVQGWAPAAAAAAGPLPWTGAEQQWLARSPLATRPPSAARGATAANLATSGATMAARQAAEHRAAADWAAALARPVPRADPAPPTGRLAAASPPPGVLQATLFAGPAHLNIVLDSRQGRRVLRPRIDVQQLSADIGRVLALIEQRADVRPALQSLYARVAADIDAESRRIGAHTWWLRLDGDLRQLPFAALHDGQAWLVERVTLLQQTQTPAPARAQAPLRAAARAADATAAWVQAFGSTRGAPGLRPLPAVADELCAVVAGPFTGGQGACEARPGGPRLHGHAWLDEAFTRQQLRQAAADGQPDRFDILHLSTHFVLHPGKVGRSWLLLGDGSRLSLDELQRWPLRSLDLVTLSACQTAAGDGAEFESLAALLLERGAGRVIASHWPVADRSTSRLMGALYEGLAAGQDAAVALRAAQRRLLAADGGPQAHPFHWAAFSVTEGWR